MLADPRKMPSAVLDHIAEFTVKSGQTAYGFVARTEGVAGKGCMALFGVAVVVGIGLAAWYGGSWEPWGPGSPCRLECRRPTPTMPSET